MLILRDPFLREQKSKFNKYCFNANSKKTMKHRINEIDILNYISKKQSMEYASCLLFIVYVIVFYSFPTDVFNNK